MKIPIKVWVVLVFLTAGSGLLPAQKSSKKQLASVDGVAITENQARTEGAEDLYSLELQNLRSKAQAAREEHKILEQAVEQLIEDKLLQAEARKLGISKDELVAKEVRQKVQDTTPEEIDTFYEINKSRIRGSKEQLTVQIGTYIREQKEKGLLQALVEKLEKEHKVVRTMEPFRFNVNPGKRPSLGPASAPVLLVLFSDFQCPYCRTYGEVIREVLKRYGDKVRLVFRQYPLIDIHPDAQRAAEASLCADDQGRFWEMHDLMFQNQKSLGEEDLNKGAAQLGLDGAKFSACLASARYAAEVREDVRAGAAVGVEGTPALFINGRFLHGTVPYDQIAAIIDDELKRKK